MIEDLKNLYDSWNSKQLQLIDHKDFVEITTPFVDMHHDPLQLVFYKKDDYFKISDDGYIINELEMLGVDVNATIKRKNFFNSTLKIFGVQYNKNDQELSITFDSLADYPKKQNNLIQCILRISDMLLTARNTVVGVFAEEVAAFFEEHEVFYSDDVGYTGKTGNYQSFDFVIPKMKSRPEQIIKAINNPISDNYKIPLLSFIDISEVRSNSNFVVLANDLNSPISDKFITPLKNYEIEVLAWSERERWVNQLKVI